MSDLTARHIAAIRACGAHPGGLRISTYPGTMPGLVSLELVEQRQKVSPFERRQVGWFLTPAGKERLRLVATGDAGNEPRPHPDRMRGFVAAAWRQDCVTR